MTCASHRKAQRISRIDFSQLVSNSAYFSFVLEFQWVKWTANSRPSKKTAESREAPFLIFFCVKTRVRLCLLGSCRCDRLFPVGYRLVHRAEGSFWPGGRIRR